MEKLRAPHYCSVLTQPLAIWLPTFFPITSDGPPPAHQASTVSLGKLDKGQSVARCKALRLSSVGKVCVSWAPDADPEQTPNRLPLYLSCLLQCPLHETLPLALLPSYWMQSIPLLMLPRILLHHLSPIYRLRFECQTGQHHATDRLTDLLLKQNPTPEVQL